MRIKKITLHTLRFFLTAEELEEYDLSPENFDSPDKGPYKEDKLVKCFQEIGRKDYGMELEDRIDWVESLEGEVMFDMETSLDTVEL